MTDIPDLQNSFFIWLKLILCFVIWGFYHFTSDMPGRLTLYCFLIICSLVGTTEDSIPSYWLQIPMPATHLC